MKVREAMSSKPVCCTPSDTAQQAAKLMRDHNVGSLPVVQKQDGGQLLGMITDRDLCISIIANGQDPKSITIDKIVTANPVTVREGENLDMAEKAMQERQVRRIPVVDGDGRCVGIVAQADLALKDKAEKVHRTVAEISKPHEGAA